MFNKLSALINKFKNKHRHHDLIQAKKNDPSLQIQIGFNGYWIDVPDPSWSANLDYRIKPKTPITPGKLRFRRYLDIGNNIRLVAIDASFRSDFVRWLGDWEEMDIDHE